MSTQTDAGQTNANLTNAGLTNAGHLPLMQVFRILICRLASRAEFVHVICECVCCRVGLWLKPQMGSWD